MTYNNPQIIKLDGAIRAIQHVDDKSVHNVTESFTQDPLWPQMSISPAYQADE